MVFGRKDEYYRVETWCESQERTVCGIVASVLAVLARRLGIRPDIPVEDWMDAAFRSKDPIVHALLGSIDRFSQLEKPPVYLSDMENHYCLFTNICFFYDCYDDLLDLSDLLSESTDGDYSLVYKKFRLKQSDLVYADDDQVVITKDLYEKKNRRARIFGLDELLDDMDEF